MEELQRLREENDRLRNDLTARSERLAKAQAENEGLKRNHETMVEDNKHLQQTKKALTDENMVLEEEGQRMTQQNDELLEENVDLEAKLAANEQTIEDLRHTVALREQDIADAFFHVDHRQRSLDQLSNDLFAANNRAAAADRKADELQYLLDSARNQLNGEQPGPW
ncbi:uncharacterized protein BKCO1_680007 [Diplodia corticola]|uniref:Uncharacterized protein n=1 Tax=Diplodia corticola TaxID=236234 RepID=A0A1J9RNB4_9PEZI|nr:uncharacterized protein BKCO1_680007 [Diplodia corticola]OJD29983.1 hypothetical protein BKCO1_680007 [Diplodia corticola]